MYVWRFANYHLYNYGRQTGLTWLFGRDNKCNWIITELRLSGTTYYPVALNPAAYLNPFSWFYWHTSANSLAKKKRSGQQDATNLLYDNYCRDGYLSVGNLFYPNDETSSFPLLKQLCWKTHPAAVILFIIILVEKPLKSGYELSNALV